jgi:hypothetical protein
MTSPASFRHHARWSSGCYELGIEVGSTDDARVQAVLGAVWAAAGVEGCYGYGDREPWEQDPVGCTVASLSEFGYLLGRVRLPTGQWVVCGCTAIRGGGGSDWLDFCLSPSSLDHAGVEVGCGTGEHRSAFLDDWLAAVGTRAYAEAPFSLGVIGFEVSGCTDAAHLAGVLPARRGIGYLLPEGGGVRYGPADC